MTHEHIFKDGKCECGTPQTLGVTVQDGAKIVDKMV